MTFAAALRCGARRDGIHLGGVYEIHPARHRLVQLGVRLLFAVLLAESHRTQTQDRYP